MAEGRERKKVTKTIIKQRGSNKGPPLGPRKQALPTLTSNGKAVHQGGGTGVKNMGGTPAKDPPYRELIRGLPEEGGIGGQREE